MPSSAASNLVFENPVAWFSTMLLLSIRLGVSVAMAPAFSAYGMPSIVRVVLVLALAGLGAASVGPVSIPPVSIDAGLGRLIVAAGAELLTGALLGLGLHVVLAAFAFAGRLLDVQIGFGIASVFDPVSRSSSNVMGALFSLLGVTLFFITGAHLALANMVAESTRVLPLGQFPHLSDPLVPLVAAGSMFTLGLALVAPVVVALLIVDAVVGVASRNLPQVNVLVLSIPLKVLVGYLLLGLSLRGWGSIVSDGFRVTGDLLGVGP